jgi:DNA invertase Pin-like site-specific DNA recombinase
VSGRAHEDKVSGVPNGRKGLAEALKGCAAGDVLVVWKLDRLARSLHDLVMIAEDLKGRGVGLKILTGEGAAVYNAPARPDDLRHSSRDGRIRAGNDLGTHYGRDASGEAPGRHVGRPRKLTSHKLDHARQLIAEGKETQAGAAALLGVGVATLRRALNQRAI